LSSGLLVRSCRLGHMAYDPVDSLMIVNQND
jgi:hypothetical protein